MLVARYCNNWISREGEVFDDFSTDEMLLDDSLDHFGGAGVVPNAFGINYGNGTLNADAETIGFGAIDHRLGTDEV